MDDGVGKPERVIRPDGMEKGLLAKGGEPEPEEQRSREPSCTDGKQSAFRRQPPLSAQDRLGMLGKCPANPPLEQRKKWPSAT